jgi:SAM-dependent methyltransferase
MVGELRKHLKVLWRWFKTSDDKLKITAVLKIFFGKNLTGKYYINKWSSHIRFVNPDWRPHFENLVNKNREEKPEAPSRFLAIGSGGRERKTQCALLPSNWEYYALDIESKEPSPKDKMEIKYLTSDVCEAIDLETNSVDFVFSNSVFEHLSNPFSAVSNISRVLKPGGIVFTKTVFSWRYHPVSEDYWRFTHSGLEALFSSAGLLTLESGYHIGARRGSILGGKIRGNLDGVKRDGYGGWRENWEVIHVGRKPE